MSLIQKIKADSLTARKSRSSVSGVLLTLLGEIETKTKTFNPARDMTDDEIVAVVQKFLKNIQETQNILAATDRENDKALLQAERSSLEAYLPKQLTASDIADIANAQKVLGKNFGDVMKLLKDTHSGAYDGKTASGIIKQVMSA